MYAMQPITYMTGSEIQAPYRTVLQPGNIESGVGFGPASRAGGGEILARHVSQPGMVWAKFSSQNTRAVDQYDPMVSGALQTQWALASAPHNTLDPTGNVSNILGYSSQQNFASIENTQVATMQAANKQAEKAAKEAKKQADKAAKEAKKQADKAAKSAKAQSCSKDGACSSCS